MIKEIITVEYGTEVEQAWEIMRCKKLKAMPVIDRARRVIGIITWNDFFKCIDLRALLKIKWVSNLHLFYKNLIYLSVNRQWF